MIKILHNNRCSKSRACLTFLEEKGQEIEIINYLEETPSVAELTAIIEKLGINPLELVRQKESLWIEKYKGKQLTDQQIIVAMVENPSLIERPILIRGNKAIVGRDLEKVSEFV